MRRRRGQALAEFALTLPIMIMIAMTTLDLFGFITTRGRVFDLAAATLEAATAAKLPYDEARATGDVDDRMALHAAQRDFLCAQLYAVATGVARSNGLPGSSAGGMPAEAPDPPCSTTPSATERIAVNVSVLRTIDEAVVEDDPNQEVSFSDNPSNITTELDPGPLDPRRLPVYIRVCVKYQWIPQGGVLYFARGVGLGAKSINQTLTWHFCGRTALDPRRSG